MIECSTQLISINDWPIALLPKEASAQLSSRNIAMVHGTINGHAFQTDLEPDGNGSHWFRLSDELLAQIDAKADDTVELAFEPMKQWPEPVLSADLSDALAKSESARKTWELATPMAHWEWVRWIRATNNTETRQRRIDVAMSKLTKGMRRPCCFNTSMCTEPSVSKNGVLLVPTN